MQFWSFFGWIWGCRIPGYGRLTIQNLKCESIPCCSLLFSHRAFFPVFVPLCLSYSGSQSVTKAWSLEPPLSLPSAGIPGVHHHTLLPGHNFWKLSLSFSAIMRTLPWWLAKFSVYLDSNWNDHLVQFGLWKEERWCWMPSLTSFFKDTCSDRSTRTKWEEQEIRTQKRPLSSDLASAVRYFLDRRSTMWATPPGLLLGTFCVALGKSLHLSVYLYVTWGHWRRYALSFWGPDSGVPWP
jgi:hypothetical protein